MNTVNSVDDAIIVQKPSGTVEQLVLLFHGVGARAQDMVPVASQLAQVLPQALVVSVNGPQPSDGGAGRQWFSVAGVTEANRSGRIASAMPLFQSTVRHWQTLAGVAADNTTLVGFSQGAIMALASTQQPPQLAGRVIAFAGRFAQAPQVAPTATTIHLIHGDADAVMNVQHSVVAASQLEALGAKVTIDIVAGMAHGIDARMVACALRKLAR